MSMSDNLVEEENFDDVGVRGEDCLSHVLERNPWCKCRGWPSLGARMAHP